jgi:hypothetical protein
MKKADGLWMQAIGILFFGTLFCFAWLCFKERMLNYDPAFFSFRILQDKNYDIELGRWGSVISQALPLWFLKLGCSLETFLRVYSVSFILIYYIIFLFISLFLKNARASVVLMFTLCLAFRHAFYYSTAELYQGLAISVLVMALVSPEVEYSTGLRKNAAYLLSAGLIYVLSYYHQILVFPLLFIFCYHLLLKKKYKDAYLIFMIALTAVWFLIRVKFLTETTYEKDKIPDLKTLLAGFPHITGMPSYFYFRHFVRHYILSLVFLNLLSVGVMVYKREWMLASFYVLFNVGFIYLNIITYAKGESPLMYENYLTVLGLYCAVPLTDILSGMKRQRLAILLVIAVLSFNLKEIYAAKYPLTQKIEYLKRMTDSGREMPEKKYLISSRNFPWSYDWVSWSLPFESLLYSSLVSPDSAVTVCTASPVNQYDSLLDWKYIFLGPPWSPTWFWTTDLNLKYYALPAGTYKKLCTSQSDTSFSESVFGNYNVVIEPLIDHVEIKKATYAVVPLRIKNNSGHLLRSVPDAEHSILLCYHVKDNNGNYVVWDGNKVYLETDIDKQAIQGLVVMSDLPKGDYILEADLMTNGKRWWGINSKISLTVK